MKIYVTTVYDVVNKEFAKWASERWFVTKDEAKDFLKGEAIKLISKDPTSQTVATTEWKLEK